MVTMYSIVFLIPLLITIGSVLFLGEVVRWKRFTAVIVGFIGAIISINPFGTAYDNYILLALFCPIFASASYLIVRKYGFKENLFSFFIFGKILMLIFSGIFALYIFKPVSLDHLMLNGAAGLIGELLQFLLLMQLDTYRELYLAQFYMFKYLVEFWWVILFFQKFLPNNYIGNIIIIAAGIYIVFREMQLKKNIVTSARHPTIPIKKLKILDIFTISSVIFASANNIMVFSL